MSKIFVKFLFFTLVLFSLYGCKDEVVKVVEDNLQALQNESLRDYLKTISKKSPALNSLKATLPQIFASLDMEYKLLSVKVVEKVEKKVEPKKEEKKENTEEKHEEEKKGHHSKINDTYKVVYQVSEEDEEHGKEQDLSALELDDETTAGLEFGETPRPTPVPITRVGKAKVKVVQVTKKKKGGPSFVDNKMVIIHELILEDNEWRIYRSEREAVYYLD